MKKQAEIDKKTTDELVRERDILNKNLLKVLDQIYIPYEDQCRNV